MNIEGVPRAEDVIPEELVSGSSENPSDANENHDAILLTTINTALADLGVTMRYKGLPERASGSEVLSGKNIVMVDDSDKVLANILPDLIIATDGHASAIHYKEEQALDYLVDKVLASGADIVIMDYHLSEIMKGTDIIRALFEKGFSGKVVGSSSDSQRGEEFLEAGAVGNFNKTTFDTGKEVAKLAKYLK